MSNTKRSAATDTRVIQTALLKILREGELTLTQALKKTKIKRSRLSKWLRGATFRDRIKPILSRLMELKKLEALLTGCVAQTRVARAVQMAKPKSMETKQLADLSQGRKKPKGKPKPKSVRRTHASVSDEQARVLIREIKQAKSELN